MDQREALWGLQTQLREKDRVIETLSQSLGTAGGTIERLKGMVSDAREEIKRNPKEAGYTLLDLMTNIEVVLDGEVGRRGQGAGQRS